MKLINLIDTLPDINRTEIEDFIDYIRFHYSTEITDNPDNAAVLQKAATQNRAGKPNSLEVFTMNVMQADRGQQITNTATLSDKS